MYSIDFWNSATKRIKEIKYDNGLKWFQYQILHHSQYTNFRVSKFRSDVSPLCTYCRQEDELISHLYFKCKKVREFWEQLNMWLAPFSFKIPLTISTILFGWHKERQDSVVNNLILWGKNYIWKNKFSTDNLSISVFLNILKYRLSGLKEMFRYLENDSLFQTWLPVYNSFV